MPAPESTVSVVMSALDEERWIGEAIESAWSQTHPPIEVVIVDDGSSDRTGEIAGSLGAVVLRHDEPCGTSTSRNEGIAVATGAFVAMHDADDVMAPTRIEHQLAYLADHTGAGCVLGRHDYIVEPGCQIPPHVARDPVFGDLGGIEPGTALGPTSVFRAVPFDPAIEWTYNWLGAIRDAGHEVAVLDEIVLHRRIHGDNLSGDPARMRTMIAEGLHARIRAARDRR